MTWTFKSVYVECNLRRTWILRYKQYSKISKSFLSCWLRMPRRKGSKIKGAYFTYIKWCACAWKLTEWNLDDMAQKSYECAEFILFFERLPKDRVKEQCPFFYSRTGDEMFLFFYFFCKVDLLTCIVMKQIIS